MMPPFAGEPSVGLADLRQQPPLKRRRSHTRLVGRLPRRTAGALAALGANIWRGSLFSASGGEEAGAGTLGIGQRTLLLCGLLTWAFCGAANEPIGLFLPQLKTEFPSLAPQQMAYVASGYTLGTAASTLAAGSLADSVGRRAVCRMAAGAAVLAVALVIFAPSFGALVAARALLGLCAGTFVVVMPALVVEGLPAKNLNAYMAGFPVGWPLGALMCSALAGFSWRQAMGGTQLLILAPLLGLLWWLPESPKFLLGKGRTGEAAEAVRRLIGGGSPEAAPADVEQEKELEKNLSDAGDQGDQERVSALFVTLAVAFLLCGVASQAMKVWLPVWLAGAASTGSSLESFRSMYAIEAVGIFATAVLIATREGKNSGEGRGGGGLLTVARGNLLLAAACSLGCLLCSGRLAAAGGLLGGGHLVAQANASTLMRACGACSLPVRGRARKLSWLSLLYLSGCCLGPVVLGAAVTQRAGAFAGVQWVLAGASALYVAAALFRPPRAR